MIFCIVALVLWQDDPAGGSFDQQLKAGRAARDQGHLVRAARELYGAARIEPRDVRLALEAAQLLLTVGNDAQANQLVRAAEQSMNKQRAWMQSLKSQLDAHIRERVQAGNAHLRAGELALARTEFDAAIAKDPERGELYIHRASVMNLLGEQDGAIAALNEALRLGMFDRQRFIEVPALQSLWADARYLDLLREAFGDGTVAMARDYWHDRASARVREGINALHRGATAAALAEFMNAVQIEPEDANLYVFQARAQALLGLRDAALASLEQAVKYGYRDRDALLELPALRTLAQEHWDALAPAEPDVDEAKPLDTEPGPPVSADAAEPTVPAVSGFTHQGTNQKGRPEYLHDATGVMFVLVPGGRLAGEGDEDAAEIAPFLIAKHEITQDVWERVMEGNPAAFKGASRPVDSVLLGEAVAFCKQNDLELPTEAQWEYACRAGDLVASAGDVDQLAWCGADETHAVASKQSNAWGLYDMLGNVWEWCLGEVAARPGAAVSRGGGFSSSAADCTPSARRGFKRGVRQSSVGFRPIHVIAG